jgi:hydrogenase-1 operon protein HyaE
MNTVDGANPGDAPALHPLFERLFREFGYASVTAADLADFIRVPDDTLLFFTEDPQRYRESLDLAVILPEIGKAFPGRFRIGVLLPESARAAAPRYGFRRWPALVLVRGGQYVGAVDGLREWNAYLSEVGALLEAPVSRPPSIGIAVTTPGGTDPGHCH